MRCIVCPLLLLQEPRWKVGFGRASASQLPNPSLPLPLQTLAGPLTEAIKAVKAFARPLVRPQIAALGRLVVRGTPGNRGTGPLVDIHSLDIDVIEDTMKLATYKGIHLERKVTKLRNISVPPLAPP